MASGGGSTRPGLLAPRACSTSVRSRPTTSAVSPTSSISSHARSVPSMGLCLVTTPSMAITSWLGSSRLSVMRSPALASNRTLIEIRFPRRSLRW
ncbi:MAG: hypothetical protein R2939_05855 [Kofleriaceae bacterium]